MAYQPMVSGPQPDHRLLNQARSAAFNGDLVVAEKSYFQLLTHNNDPDLHGELGNVYFMQQNWPAAAREYAMAVDGLVLQGRLDQAQYMLGFLMQINPELGQQSYARMQGHLYSQQPRN
jgi:uncharacterized protein HemY